MTQTQDRTWLEAQARRILTLLSTTDSEHRRDLGAIAKLVDDKIAYEAPWNEPPFITSTKADYLSILERSQGLFGSIVYEFRSVWADEQTGGVTIEMKGTSTLASTGKQAIMRKIIFCRFQNGLLTEMREYTHAQDAANMMAITAR